MARPLRRELPDGLYHATARAVADTLLFRDAEDYRTFLLILLDVVERFDWEVHALCFMGTHYHLVLDGSQPNLSAGMKRLNERYARSYNDRYGRHGHVFGDRFAARVIEDQQHYCEACRYIVDNPVAAGLCDDVEEWPWTWCIYGIAEAATSLQPPAVGRVLSLEAGVERDLRPTGEGFGNGTVRLRSLRRHSEAVVIEPLDPADDLERALRDAGARHERDGGRGRQALRRRPGLCQRMRERHREARRMRRRDELLRTRAAGRILGTRRPRHVQGAEGAASDAVDRPGALQQAALPGDLRPTLRRHARPPPGR
jgi:REP element-mobilizing transposase RayT